MFWATSDEAAAQGVRPADVVKGIICHGLWLAALDPRGRPRPGKGSGPCPQQPDRRHPQTWAPNTSTRTSSSTATLVTGRTGPTPHLFARTLIDVLAERRNR